MNYSNSYEERDIKYDHEYYLSGGRGHYLLQVAELPKYPNNPLMQ